MTALMITTEPNEMTIDNLTYMFTRSRIDYSVFKYEKGEMTVFKRNNMRRSLSSITYFNNGKDYLGRSMPKFLKEFLELTK